MTRREHSVYSRGCSILHPLVHLSGSLGLISEVEVSQYLGVEVFLDLLPVLSIHLTLLIYEDRPGVLDLVQLQLCQQPLVVSQDHLLGLGLEHGGLQQGPGLALGADHQHGEN